MDEATRSTSAYLNRAQQLRAEAEGIKHAETKLALLDIAATYERLAKSVAYRSEPQS